MGLVSKGLSERTRYKCRLSGEEDELVKEDPGQRVPGRRKKLKAEEAWRQEAGQRGWAWEQRSGIQLG